MAVRRIRVESELSAVQLEALHQACDDVEIDRQAWPHVPMLRQWAVGVAAHRRIRRLERIERLRRAAALKRAAADLGVTVAALRAALYRTQHAGRTARRKKVANCSNPQLAAG